MTPYTRTMKVQLFDFKCANCANQFKAPALGAPLYGEFLMRSIGNAENAYLNAFEDKTYDEVSTLLDENFRLTEKSQKIRAKILQQTYGLIACDPDSMGQPFQIGMSPKCPLCGSQEMESWEATEPPEFIEKELRSVSHTAWTSLSEPEKKALIEDVLLKLGY